MFFDGEFFVMFSFWIIFWSDFMFSVSSSFNTNFFMFFLNVFLDNKLVTLVVILVYDVFYDICIVFCVYFFLGLYSASYRNLFFFRCLQGQPNLVIPRFHSTTPPYKLVVMLIFFNLRCFFSSFPMSGKSRSG